MLDLLLIVVFCWLFFKALGLMFRLTWGVAKIAVGLLLVLAVPMLVGCLLLTGGLLLLVPTAIVGAALFLLLAFT